MRILRSLLPLVALLSLTSTCLSVAVRNQVIDSGSRLYAVMALRAAPGEVTDGRTVSAETFQTMLSDLAGDIDRMYDYLGFQIVDSDSFPKRVKNTFGSGGHVVFVLNTHGGDEQQYKDNLYDEHGEEREVESYSYPLGWRGHRWRYALADATSHVGQNLKVIRQCEDRRVWKACSYAK